MAYKTIHQIEKIIFVLIVMLTVEPVNDITPHQFIMYNSRIISCTCRAELIVCIKIKKFFFKM